MDEFHVLGVVAIFGFLSAIPITAILTAHQRKMAEIIHRAGGIDANAVASLAQEVADLRHIVAQQAIALDDMATMNRRLLERTKTE